MTDFNITLPSKPRVVKEEGLKGVYEIDGLSSGYGYTLGNSLRRIILSSIPGCSVTVIKIDGVSHEFATIEGVKDDVINIILNLKRVRFNMTTDEPQIVKIKGKGIGKITAKDIEVPGQVEVLNSDQYITELTEKNTKLNIEVRIEKGLGYVPKEEMQKEKMEVGTIAVDAVFTPIRRVSYEVENMRVEDKTDFHRLRMTIETDGSLTPREALEYSINIMIQQLKAIVGFKEKEEDIIEEDIIESKKEVEEEEKDVDTDYLKIRVENLNLSLRTQNALLGANIRTVGGVLRKKEKDLLDLEGLGDKGIQEIKRALSNFGILLRQ